MARQGIPYVRIKPEHEIPLVISSLDDLPPWDAALAESLNESEENGPPLEVIIAAEIQNNISHDKEVDGEHDKVVKKKIEFPKAPFNDS